MDKKDTLFIFLVFFVVGMAVLAYYLNRGEALMETTKVSDNFDLVKFNDGICDDELNVEKFNYDNGDCCGGDASSRIWCETCRCNATIMNLLREQHGLNEECGILDRPGIYSSPYNGICDAGKNCFKIFPFNKKLLFDKN